jgi:hypothetical protein
VKQGQQKRSLLIVGFVVTVIVAARLASSGFFHRTGTIDARVRLQDNQLREITERQRQQQVGAFNAIIEGEVSRTEERIREATALATAASLFAASESLNRRTPTSVTTLLSSLNRVGLMPPGVRLLNTQGDVACSHGKFFVRYRPEPLGVEVVSLGEVRLDGPALLVRVPDRGISGTNEEGAGLYLASRLDEITVPSPFASEAEVVALGFAPEPLRAAKLPQP